MTFSINYDSHPLGKVEQQGEEKQGVGGLGLEVVGVVEVLSQRLIQMYWMKCGVRLEWPKEQSCLEEAQWASQTFLVRCEYHASETDIKGINIPSSFTFIITTYTFTLIPPFSQLNRPRPLQKCGVSAYAKSIHSYNENYFPPVHLITLGGI